MKPGTYYIGDPCYIFNQSWSEILKDHNYFNNESNIFNIKGYECAVGSTAYGDGSYYDNDGNMYYVDAGLIGILPIEIVNIDKCYTLETIRKSTGMYIKEFENDFSVDINNGVFVFGDTVIDTVIDTSNYDYDYDYDDEE